MIFDSDIVTAVQQKTKIIQKFMNKIWQTKMIFARTCVNVQPKV